MRKGLAISGDQPTPAQGTRPLPTREHLKRPDVARRLLRALYTTEADLLPDSDAGTLTVRLNHGANAATDQAIETLCKELNATETVFPRTNLRLVLKLGST